MRVLISLVPSKESKELLNKPNPSTFQSDLYSAIYNLNEGYYKNLLFLVEESKFTKVKRFFKNALQYLLPESDKFIRISFKINQLNAYHCRTIWRYAKKDEVFNHSKFLMKDLKSKYPIAPHVEAILKDEEKYKWFFDHKTPEHMMRYLDNSTKVRFKEGFYRPGRIVGMTTVFAEESIENMKKAKQSVEDSKLWLDKQEDLDKDKKEQLYMQLTVYYRAILYLYGLQLTNLTTTIETMLHEVRDEKLKQNMFNDDYDYIKNFMKDLI